FIPVLSEEPDLPEMSRRYRFNSGFRAVGRTGSTNTAIQPVKSHGVAERCANSGRMSGCEGVESADPRASREARLWRDKPWLEDPGMRQAHTRTPLSMATAPSARPGS